MIRAFAIALAMVAAACRAAPAPVTRAGWPDAPVQLRDDRDRDAAIDRLWVTAPGPARDRVRADIAAAIARRIADAVADDRPFAAAALLDQMVSLWGADPAAIAGGLAAHAPLLRTLRAMFAKAGALEPAVLVLVVLAEVDPPARGAHLAELDEILDFADHLAAAEHGADARRGQPLALLRPAATALPLPWLVERYVTQLIERQTAVAALLQTRGASMQLVRAHADAIATTRRIAAALARAGREGEIHAALQRLKPGIGAAADGRDRELRIAAEIAAEHPTAASYLELAARLRGDDRDGDPGAALAVALVGLVRFPDDAELLASAGRDARTLGRIDQAIALLERALHGAAEVDATAALRLGKLYGERIARLAEAGRPRAAASAWQDVVRFTAGVARAHPHAVWQQAAAIAESALGRGLAGQGLLDEGRRALTASLERAPSIDALETLTQIDAQVDRFASAQRWAREGIALLADDTAGDRYRRAKLERVSADALRRAGHGPQAAARYLDALRSWSSLGEAKDLPRGISAERMLDSGRCAWWLGDEDRAVELVLAAVDTDSDTTAIAAGAVAFLIEIGRYRDALDAFHRGLGEPNVAEPTKIYMSLWIVGEARRRGEPRDRLAYEYLAGRRGELWHERLAQAATGRLSFAELRAAATTGPRRGEAAFYGAVLGLDPDAATPAGRRRLLQEVVSTRAVLDAEYDLARAYLADAAPRAR